MTALPVVVGACAVLLAASYLLSPVAARRRDRARRRKDYWD